MKDCVLNVVQLVHEIFLKVADERGSHQKVISRAKDGSRGTRSHTGVSVGT